MNCGIFGARTAEASFKHPAPGYVQYQRPPVVEPIEPLVLETGERLDAQIKYYDYGVLSVVFELPFSGDWDTLVRLSGRWVWDTDFASLAMKAVKKKLERAAPALVKPYENWLHEDYLFSTCARWAQSRPRRSYWRPRRPKSHKSSAAKPPSFPRVSAPRFCKAASRITRMIWP